MFLNKIKNNNKGVDMSLIGTSYIFVLLIAVCGIIDLFIMMYAKNVTVNVVKNCEYHALAKHYDESTMWKVQFVETTALFKELVTAQCWENLSSSIIGDHGFMEVSIDHMNVYARDDFEYDSFVLTTENIKTTPKKILGSGDSFMFLGDGLKGGSYGDIESRDSRHPSSLSGDCIVSGVATKIAFFPHGGV